MEINLTAHISSLLLNINYMSTYSETPLTPEAREQLTKATTFCPFYSSDSMINILHDKRQNGLGRQSIPPAGWLLAIRGRAPWR
jgi:hypothetical protein